MTKRLTLTEYRQQNATWLSNEHYKRTNHIDEPIYNFLVLRYLIYLLAFGIDKKVMESVTAKIVKATDKSETITITSEQIEEILADEVKHEMD